MATVKTARGTYNYLIPSREPCGSLARLTVNTHCNKGVGGFLVLPDHTYTEGGVYGFWG